MADERRLVLQERAGAEHMVRMRMAHHHVADRQRCALLDRGAQGGAVGEAAARVEHQHRLLADDEAGIGDGVGVAGRRLLVHAAAHMDAGRDLAQRERRRGARAAERQAAGAHPAEDELAAIEHGLMLAGGAAGANWAKEQGACG